MYAEVKDKVCRFVMVEMPLADAKNLLEQVRDGIQRPNANDPVHRENIRVLKSVAAAFEEAGVR